MDGMRIEKNNNGNKERDRERKQRDSSIELCYLSDQLRAVIRSMRYLQGIFRLLKR